MKKALAFLKEYIKKTDPIFKQLWEEELEAAKKEGKIIEECIRHISKISFKGKRLRGALTVLGYELVGKKPDKKILKASLAIEIFHTSVLIHDDVLDRDILRRGEPTAHIVFKNLAKEKLSENDPSHYGIAQAINIGDYGYFLTFKLLLNSGLPEPIILKAQKIFVDALIKVIKGQMLDITHLSLEKTEEEEILKIFQYKTAEYTGVLPLELGMILAGEQNKKKLEKVRQLGNYLGWAFQIKDDVLGIFGDPKKTGKPIGSDLREGKNTLFVHYVLKNKGKKEKEFFKKYLGKKCLTEKDVKLVQKFLKEVGALKHLEKELEKYRKKAYELTDEITQDKNLNELLKSFITLAIEREK